MSLARYLREEPEIGSYWVGLAHSLRAADSHFCGKSLAFEWSCPDARGRGFIASSEGLDGEVCVGHGQRIAATLWSCGKGRKQRLEVLAKSQSQLGRYSVPDLGVLGDFSLRDPGSRIARPPDPARGPLAPELVPVGEGLEACPLAHGE